MVDMKASVQEQEAIKGSEVLRTTKRFATAAAAQGQVQKAQGQNETVDTIWDEFCEIEGVKQEFSSLYETMDMREEKALAVQTLVPIVRRKVNRDAEALEQRRASTLKGFRAAAEKCSIPWVSDVELLQSRGMDVWEAERASVTDAGLVTPDYYVYGGQGALHSYKDGNCNWEAAFDAKSAFELVHMHHFPKLSPSDCMDELHKRLDDATLDAVRCGPIRRVVDVGCGVGTSTFSLRRSLDRHGFQDAMVTAVDLSTHFVTVARYRQHRGDQSVNKWSESKLSFKHGDGLQLSRAGIADESCEVVMFGKVSHEAPTHVNYLLVKEMARVLKPGGVVGYVDLNPSQMLKQNPVSALALRVAEANEPFMDQFLELDMHDVFQRAGMTVVCEMASNPDQWPDIDNAPVRFMVARKPCKRSWTSAASPHLVQSCREKGGGEVL